MGGVRTLYLFLCCVSVAAQGVVTAGRPATAVAPGVERAAEATKPELLCTVEGSVIDSATGSPLKKAHLTMYRTDGSSNMGEVRPYGADTDSSGAFLIEGVEPGKYSLMARRNGYAAGAYGAKRATRQGSGARLTLSPAQKLKDLTVRLTPQGVITGRVVDEDGEPMPHVQVQCLRSAYWDGKKRLMPAGNANTNDKGEYRAFGLLPGRYYVSASYREMDFANEETRRQDTNEESYVTSYFPNTTSQSSAGAVEVTAGLEVGNIDLRMTRTRAARISGRVVNMGAQNRPAMLMLAASGDGVMFDRPLNTMADAKGNFVFRGVQPGSYTLIANDWADNAPKTATVPLEVGTSNIDNVVVAPGQNPDITGTVQVSDRTDVKGLSLQVTLGSEGIWFGTKPVSEVKDDGSFKLLAVTAQRHRVNVYPVPDGYYIRSVRFADVDLPDLRLDFSRGVTPGDLAIVLSKGAPEVQGTVQDQDQKPVVGSTVVAIPAERDRTHLYRQTTTDQYGKYTLKGLTPGRYKLFAWDEVESGAYQDPDFLKPFESKGEEISVDENGKATKDLILNVVP